MKKVLYWGVVAVLPFLASCSNVPGGKELKLSNSSDSISAALGLIEYTQLERLAEQLPFLDLDWTNAAALFAEAKVDSQYVAMRTRQFGSFDADVFKTSYLNQLSEKPGDLDEMRASAYLQMQYEKQVEIQQAQANERSKASGDDGTERGRAFLQENASRPEVEILSSGLQYEVLTQGSGARPTLNDRVRCHYHGTLIDGTVFDSSVQRGEPLVFGLGQVIKGWQEALQLMPVGSKWKLYVPSELAYGERGAGSAIGPNEALIFEVELLGIE